LVPLYDPLRTQQASGGRKGKTHGGQKKNASGAKERAKTISATRKKEKRSGMTSGRKNKNGMRHVSRQKTNKLRPKAEKLKRAGAKTKNKTLDQLVMGGSFLPILGFVLKRTIRKKAK